MSHTSGWIPYISHQNLIRKRMENLKDLKYEILKVEGFQYRLMIICF